jgi:hypothetical protein
MPRVLAGDQIFINFSNGGGTSFRGPEFKIAVAAAE